MTYALIKNGIIQNVIVADSDVAAQYVGDYDYVVQIPDSPGSPFIGWSYDGSSFTPPAAEQS